MVLYVDMGNSRIKFLLDEGDIATARMFSQDYTADDWLVDIDEQPDQVIALYVTNQAQAEQLQQHCQYRWGLSVTWLQTTATAAGLTNAYSVPANLGIDRWAVMAGAYALQQQDWVIADFGTATTIDALTNKGQHLGGWIVPGIQAMCDLQQQRLPHLYRTGALPGKTVLLAKDTADALVSGIWQSQVAALERFMTISTTKGLQQPGCILTGGHASAVAKLCSFSIHIEPRLVFYGMQQLALT